MSDIPEWAMQKADEIWAEIHAHKIAPFSKEKIIARALMSADREATERCAKIAATTELYSGDHLINSDPRVTIAAAIRKGTPHD